MRKLLTLIVLFWTGAAVAGGLKITEDFDAFTQERSLHAKVIVCQYQRPMGQCSTLYLGWYENSPEHVTLIVEQSTLDHVRQLFFRVDGEIVSYAINRIIDYDISEGVAGTIDVESSSAFVVPIDTLRAVAEDDGSRLVRAQSNETRTYDFNKKHMFGKRPFERLQIFIDRVES